MIDVSVPLATFAFVTTLSPGPNNLVLLTSGANFGIIQTTPHIVGIAIGFGMMVIRLGAGLAHVLEDSPLFDSAMQALSVVFLCWLAWRLAQVKSIRRDVFANKKGRPISFLEAAAFQWVNTKA